MDGGNDLITSLILWMSGCGAEYVYPEIAHKYDKLWLRCLIHSIRRHLLIKQATLEYSG